jgi:hypothetical protein
MNVRATTKFYKEYAFGRDPLSITEKNTLNEVFKFPEGTSVAVLGGTTKKIVLKAENSKRKTVILGFSHEHFFTWERARLLAIVGEVTLLDAGGNVVWTPAMTYNNEIRNLIKRFFDAEGSTQK